MMSFRDAIGETFFNYMNFRDRAARAEYWWWLLFATIVILVAVALDVVVFYIIGNGHIMPFLLITYVALIFPSLSLTVRRLHDTNRSGWWLLLSVALSILVVVGGLVAAAINPFNPLSGAGLAFVAVPMILSAACSILILIWMFLPSNKGNNRYGPNRYAGDLP